jgi:metallophosphoesterase (TIGR03767 family)
MYRVAGLVLAIVLGAPGLAWGDTTVDRTIQDCNGDNLLEFRPGERHTVLGADPEPPAGDPCSPKGGAKISGRSLLNFLQLTDFQAVDEESPGRVEFLDTTQRGPFNPFSAAYRPQESLTTQVMEAMVREVRGVSSPVTGARPQLTILTGDNADSQQYNETRWFIDLLDGRKRIDPNSGRPTAACPGTPGSVYDGVRDQGQAGVPDAGYYEPDRSGGQSDGDGYSPDRGENIAETPGRDVTVRDFRGLFEAANTAFDAVGVGMPWYSANGNHDNLVQGNSPEAYLGPGGAFPPNSETSNAAYQTLATGCLKPTALGGPPAPPDSPLVPGDERRCYLAKEDPIGAPAPCDKLGWIDQHFNTTGTPRGHGFANRPPPARLNHDAYYSFVPKTGVRFVVLDTITDECGSEFCAEGSVDDTQFNWLRQELVGAAAKGELVLAFSHHTLRTTRQPQADPTEQPVHYGERIDRRGGQPQPPSAEQTLEELFCAHPNVIAHIAGHEHENYVEHHACGGDTPPTPGAGDFWHVSTAAHIDWPQQSRLIELVDEKGKLTLVLTVIDHSGPPNPGAGPASTSVTRLASIARELAYNDYQGSRAARGGRTDRNVIIRTGRPAPKR